MLFDDLPLYRAIHKVYPEVPRAGSDDRTRDKTILKLILQQIVEDEAWTEEGIPWSPRRVLAAWIQYRKSMKTRLICKVSMIHGDRCFYANRGLGPCSCKINLDRIIPGSRSGAYSVRNCIMACSFHNQSRGDESIEDFFLRGWMKGEKTADECVQMIDHGSDEHPTHDYVLCIRSDALAAQGPPPPSAGPAGGARCATPTAGSRGWRSITGPTNGSAPSPPMI